MIMAFLCDGALLRLHHELRPLGCHAAPAELDDAALRVDVDGLGDQQRLAARQFQQARSEEHTSELQSLMRIPYAVFCLKKTNARTHINSQTDTPDSTDDEL